MSDLSKSEEIDVGKRDSFLADLRDEAKAKGLIFEVSKRRGKGSHALVRVGDRDDDDSRPRDRPEDARKIRKSLGLG